jgi:tetratricopeptide (TPR) repeat protein
VTVAMILLSFGSMTYFQIGIWHDDETLWRHTLRVTQTNDVAHDNLGMFLVTQGRWDEAVEHFRAVVEIAPNDAAANRNLGLYEQAHGRPLNAVAHYERVLASTTDPKIELAVHDDLASAYFQARDYARAQEHFAAVLRLKPDQPKALLGMGLIAQRSGDPITAVDLYTRAVAVRPSDVGYLLLARALQENGRPQEAEAARKQAQRLSGDLTRAQNAVDNLLAY